MMVLSFKLTKRKAVVIGFAVVMVILFGAVFLWSRGVSDDSIATARSAKVDVSASTNEQRVTFLKSFQYTVNDDPAVEEVTIPSEFGDVYQQYNKIQKAQGFDLTKYKGKRVKHYTYTITNYPGKADGVRANLLVFEDRIIGGDVSSTELAGFMHGFEKPAADSTASQKAA
jgi:hypothetical protein